MDFSWGLILQNAVVAIASIGTVVIVELLKARRERQIRAEDRRFKLEDEERAVKRQERAEYDKARREYCRLIVRANTPMAGEEVAPLLENVRDFFMANPDWTDELALQLLYDVGNSPAMVEASRIQQGELRKYAVDKLTTFFEAFKPPPVD